MWILLVEDDPDQAELIKSKLNAEFRECVVRVISTESDFRRSVDGIANDPPAVVVMDIMLRWCDVGPDMPAQPEDVLLEGYSRAGVRCCQLLKEDPRTRNTPVVVYSVLDAVGLLLPEGVVCVSKVSDMRLLYEATESAIRRQGSTGSEVFAL
jgi:CheY-like chemotaxis protein